MKYNKVHKWVSGGARHQQTQWFLLAKRCPGSVYGTDLNMNEDWENTFADWASSPSPSEQTRCENSIRAIRNAVSSSAALRSRAIKVFVQGSYRNRVNIRSDSDVDVGVVCHDVYIPRYETGVSATSVGSADGNYSFGQFKLELQAALIDHFGAVAVNRGNKAFKLTENSYRVLADIVPLFEFRHYWNSTSYRAGVCLFTDDDKRRIENYPERIFDHWPDTPLHYENGVSKNDVTGRKFKGSVRILKKLCSWMKAESPSTVPTIPGYLIECLVYNTPNATLSSSDWCSTIENTLNHLWRNVYGDEPCLNWTEVDGIKFLFRPAQCWTRQQAFDFVCLARTRLGIS
ncbi:MAG: nucleotidyltransferase [Maricaulis sp.]|nr:nucleotidyltransferase [Maricaulis sp.]